MKVVVVSPFPPLRDGVGKYAAQEVRWLRDQGHEVEVLAPVPCAAHHVEDFKGGFRLARLRRYARRYDRMILQYQPSHYHSRGSGPSRILSNLAMAWVFWRTANLTVVCHEVEYPPPEWPRWRPETVLQRWAWRLARDVVFHTQREADAMAERLGATPRSATVRDHGGHFQAAVVEPRDVARRKLGLPTEPVIFICIGFIQNHKGFDRAMRALRRIRDADARLVVVGSVRSETPEVRAYVQELAALAAADERIDLVERMVSDEEFDRWICASDVVILPYREIWSSGVLERAKLVDRPVIATDVGGVSDQARPEDVIVAGDEELAQAMAAACGGAVRGLVSNSIDAAGAQELVDAEADRRRSADAAAVGESVRGLTRVPRVHPVVLPSSRPVLGPLLTLVKRVLARGAGWYAVPMLGQINTFEDLTVAAVTEIERAVGELRTTVAELSDKTGGLAWEQGSHRHHHETIEPRWAGFEERLGTIERRTRALAVSATTGEGHPDPRTAATAPTSEHASIDYHAFEAAFRGDEATIKRTQAERYLDVLRDAGPVVDVGCGRGELLDVLRDAGVPAQGVDIDLDMVESCRAKGLDAVQGDGIAFVGALEPGSRGAVIAAQVIEHLPVGSIVGLLANAKRALRPGGLLVLETINPSSLYALANWYVMDMTHSQPVHPETLRFLARQEGFVSSELRFFAPVRDEPVALDVGGDAPAWAADLVGRIEGELRRLEEVVFGPQDYALIARA